MTKPSASRLRSDVVVPTDRARRKYNYYSPSKRRCMCDSSAISRKNYVGALLNQARCVCVCVVYFRGRGCACGACILVARDRQACANRVFVLIISGTTALICRRWRAETRNVGRHVELNRFDYIFVVLVLLNRYLFQNETANYPGCTNRMQLICEASQICFRWVIKVMIALVFLRSQ